MLRISPILVTQLLIDLADDKFGKDNCDEDKAWTLFASFASKNLTGVSYLISVAKKAFNLLQQIFI